MEKIMNIHYFAITRRSQRCCDNEVRYIGFRVEIVGNENAIGIVGVQYPGWRLLEMKTP
jgi:hypothetical protein